MATLTLENVPEELVTKLGEAAEQDKCSLNAQALYWLEQKAGHWAACQEREKILRRMCQKYQDNFA
jgi:flagellar biosynthesis chaperone FliJ